MMEHKLLNTCELNIWDIYISIRNKTMFDKIYTVRFSAILYITAVSSKNFHRTLRISELKQNLNNLTNIQNVEIYNLILAAINKKFTFRTRKIKDVKKVANFTSTNIHDHLTKINQ